MEALRPGRGGGRRREPYAGEIAEIDHTVPVSVAQELDNKLFNLEFMRQAPNWSSVEG